MQPGSVDQVKQQNADQSKSQHRQIRAQIPQVRDNHIPDFGDFFDLWEYLLVCQPK